MYRGRTLLDALLLVIRRHLAFAVIYVMFAFIYECMGSRGIYIDGLWTGHTFCVPYLMMNEQRRDVGSVLCAILCEVTSVSIF